MPRNTVFSTDTDLLPTGSPGDPGPAPRCVPGQRGLSVHHSRGAGFVQLSPRAAAHDSSHGDPAHPPAEPLVPDWWITLDWAGCNRLIRFIRTARDQAFGRPE